MGLRDKAVTAAKAMAYNYPKASCLILLIVILLSVHMVLLRNHFFHIQRFFSGAAKSTGANNFYDCRVLQVTAILPSLLLYFVIIPGMAQLLVANSDFQSACFSISASRSPS